MKRDLLGWVLALVLTVAWIVLLTAELATGTWRSDWGWFFLPLAMLFAFCIGCIVTPLPGEKQ